MKKVFVCLGFTSMCFFGKTQDDSLSTTVMNSSGIETNVTTSTSETGEPVYKLKPKVDIPLTVATAGWTIYGFTQVYSKDNSTEEQINRLNVNDINGFDRWAADVWSEKAADASDLIFYGSMPLPALLFLDKKMRKDAGKISFLYLEAMSITGLLYTGSAHLFDRYRPYTYNPNTPMGDRVEGNAKNSFPAGHVAVVGTSTFFIAKVFADYHPESKLKWLFYTGAALATGTTGYLRHRGGRHFPSDIVVGTAVGALSGILVPHFHKNKALKTSGLSVMPFTGRSHGLALVYKFK